ncbi:hypothetical protein EV199_3510 [Pseudobacter ginsenosidimutans]|uniref:Uncharacterized protein n=1 Tax=Pseudobacter ginsenosidimutans TaxID=661488 RepID=A0A4Q7MUG0_9BACT|nr:hypothetical protein EV199_3510 [Pseudobacter ginsenosidimutans]
MKTEKPGMGQYCSDISKQKAAMYALHCGPICKTAICYCLGSELTTFSLILTGYFFFSSLIHFSSSINW